MTATLEKLAKDERLQHIAGLKKKHNKTVEIGSGVASRQRAGTVAAPMPTASFGPENEQAGSDDDANSTGSGHKRKHHKHHSSGNKHHPRRPSDAAPMPPALPPAMQS